MPWNTGKEFSRMFCIRTVYEALAPDANQQVGYPIEFNDSSREKARKIKRLHIMAIDLMCPL